MAKTEEPQPEVATPTNIATITNIIPDVNPTSAHIKIVCQNDKFKHIKPENRFYLHKIECGARSARELGAIFKHEDGKPMTPPEIAENADKLKLAGIKVIAEHKPTERDGKKYDNWDLTPVSTAVKKTVAIQVFKY